LPPIEDVALTIRCPQKPAAVYLEPGRRDVIWAFADGELSVGVPAVAIHDILIVEQPSDAP
jgi:hypothetical protein